MSPKPDTPRACVPPRRMIVTAEEILADMHQRRAWRCTLEDFADIIGPLWAENLTRRQIGHRLGISENAVAARILRAQRKGVLGPRPQRTPAPLTPAQACALHTALVNA